MKYSNTTCDISVFDTIAHCIGDRSPCPKKGTTLFLALTLPDANRFSNFSPAVLAVNFLKSYN